MAAIPELEPHCGSWICTSPAGEVREVFTRKTAETLARYGWRVQTAAAYLAELNKRIKNDSLR